MHRNAVSYIDGDGSRSARAPRRRGPPRAALRPVLKRAIDVAAAALLLLLAVRDLLLRPRLSAGPLGVVVRTLGGRRELPWSLLRVRVRTARRFGVRSRTLELDTAAGPDDPGVLVLLGRRDLGTDPEEVASRLRELAASS